MQEAEDALEKVAVPDEVVEGRDEDAAGRRSVDLGLGGDEDRRLAVLHLDAAQDPNGDERLDVGPQDARSARDAVVLGNPGLAAITSRPAVQSASSTIFAGFQSHHEFSLRPSKWREPSGPRSRIVSSTRSVSSGSRARIGPHHGWTSCIVRL